MFVNGIKTVNEKIDKIVAIYTPEMENAGSPKDFTKTYPQFEGSGTWLDVTKKVSNDLTEGRKRAWWVYLIMTTFGLLAILSSLAGLGTTSDSTVGWELTTLLILPTILLGFEIVLFIVLAGLFYLAAIIPTYPLELLLRASGLGDKGAS